MTELLVAHGVTNPSLARALPDRGAVVLSLDFWTSRHLAAAGRPFRTPVEYLDGVDFADLDRTAREMAAEWERPISDRLLYRKVPLGEMAEAEFLGLFIDAVRSIEVAHRVLTSERPSTIRLMPPGNLPEPIGLCYATLPRALTLVGRQQGIPSAPLSVRRAPDAPTWSVRASAVREARNVVQVVVPPKSLGPDRRDACRGTVLFLDQASFECLAPRLRERGYRSRLAMPTWTWNLGAAAERQRLADLWARIRNDSAFFERLRYRDTSVLMVVRPWIAWFLARRAVELAGIVDHFRRLARSLRPVAVVTMQDISPDCRTVARLFRLLGVPVVVVQHGAVSADMAGFHVLPKEGRVQAVWGETSRDWHLARGKLPASQVITGNPRFDGLMQFRASARSDVLRPLGLDPAKPTALLATEWFYGMAAASTMDGEEKALAGVLAGLKAVPDLQVVVKLHPTHQQEAGPRTAQILRECASNAVIARDGLWELLAASDVVLIFNSTVGLEALLLDRPLVTIEYFPRTEKIPYAAWGTALAVTEPSRLAPTVTRALSDEPTRGALRAARSAMLDRIVFSRDGRSSGRVADLVVAFGDAASAHPGQSLGGTYK